VNQFYFNEYNETQRSQSQRRAMRPIGARRVVMTYDTATASGSAVVMAAMAAMVEALREWAVAAARRDAAWRAAVAACAPLLASLAGLAAQMRAAQRLAWDGTPLGAFSELRERLWRKQRGAAEALLEELCERR